MTVNTEHLRIYIQNAFDTISNTICPYGAPPTVGGGRGSLKDCVTRP